MDWLHRLGEPLAATREEAEAYLEDELDGAVPAGWTFERIPGDAAAWIITSGSSRDYGVRLTAGLDHVIFTYGNNDAGAFGLPQALQKALVVEASLLRHFGVAACLHHLMTGYPPNQWGLT